MEDRFRDSGAGFPFKWRLEAVLLAVLLLVMAAAAMGLLLLKSQHDRQAHLAATATVLQRGESLLDGLAPFEIASGTNLTPEAWRRFSTAVDSAFATREDVQSLSVTRAGETVFHRQASGLAAPVKHVPAGSFSGSEISSGTLEIGGLKQPVFVITRTLADDSAQVVVEVMLRRGAVTAEERTARALVASLFYFALGVLVLAFMVCAAILLVAVARDRRRALKARREEHLAFSGVWANGILHDFRNPMSAVRLDAQMLQRETERDAGARLQRVAELAQRISQTMTRMDSIFQEFLLLARPDREEPQLFDLMEAAGECIATAAPRCEQSQVKLSLTAPSAPIMLRAHPLAFKRALLNILINAIQFSPPRGEIRVEVVDDGKNIKLMVSDQGPGIAPGQRTRVFEMFVTTRPEGTGLGLFLAHSAIAACGGTLVADEAAGGGCRMTITLPRTMERGERGRR